MPLTITVVEAPTRVQCDDGKYCGGARSKVKWSAPGTGYVIQHIRVVDGRKNCYTDKDLDLVGWPDSEYWECWQVSSGTVKYPGGRQPKWDDCFFIPCQGQSYGSAEIIGEVQFFPNYKLSGVWKNNQTPEAGCLKTTPTAPPGWNAGSALAHTLRSEWNCCHDQDTGSVTGTPTGPMAEIRARSAPVNKVLKSLSTMPKWSETDIRNHAAIEAAAAEIASADLKTIRAAIRIYAQWAEAKTDGPEIGDLSRLFVLNRFLFNVPLHVALGEISFFGGWHGVRAGRGRISPLWPWTVVRGRKRLAGAFQGYSGPAYLGLAEFDYFRRRFSNA